MKRMLLGLAAAAALTIAPAPADAADFFFGVGSGGYGYSRGRVAHPGRLYYPHVAPHVTPHRGPHLHLNYGYGYAPQVRSYRVNPYRWSYGRVPVRSYRRGPSGYCPY